MIDINLIRTNPYKVRENIRKKFQDKKLPLVDEVLSLDAKRRALIAEGDSLRAARNSLSKQVGVLMKEGKKDEAEKVKAQVTADAARLAEIEKENEDADEALKKAMMAIPNIIADDVPIGKKCRIIWIFWKDWTASTWIPRAALPGRAFIILRAILPVCIPPCLPMPAIS